VTIPGELRPLLAAWSIWVHEHSAEILADPLLHALALASRKAIGEANVAAARLQAELDSYQGRTVYHCPDVALDYATDPRSAAILVPDVQVGDILRGTGTGREFEWRGPETGWQPRA
jgi:hypothetical protein